MLETCTAYLQRHLLYYKKHLTYIKNYFRCCFANMLLQTEQALVDDMVVNLEVISVLCSEADLNKEENKPVQGF